MNISQAAIKMVRGEISSQEYREVVDRAVAQACAAIERRVTEKMK